MLSLRKVVLSSSWHRTLASCTKNVQIGINRQVTISSSAAQSPSVEPSYSQPNESLMSQNKLFNGDQFPHRLVEGVQGSETEVDEFSASEARQILQESVEYSIHGPSIQGIQDGYMYTELKHGETFDSSKSEADVDCHVSAYNCSNNINLHGCMQTNVPTPYSVTDVKFMYNNARAEYVDQGIPANMPGSSKKMFQKYVSGGRNDLYNQNVRDFHTSSTAWAQQEALKSDNVSIPSLEENRYLFPQGVQGDDCVQHKLWMENCLRYNLPNCDEQLQSLQSGRKTLAQVFAEQEELIRSIAENYKHSESSVSKNSDSQERSFQGLQPNFSNNVFDIEAPVPQGIQGDDCVQFKLWLQNCHRFGIEETCQEQLDSVNSGRKTLADIFREQDYIIRSAIQQYQSKRNFSTSSSNKKDEKESEVGTESKSNPIHTDNNQTPTSETPPSSETNNETPLSQGAKLKKAVAEYGSTVIVFHIGISLISLGGFYLLISSGVDAVGILVKLGIGEQFFQSKIASGASTFVIAYAVHKLFAPVRIGITLTSAPIIVHYLRRSGFLKPVKKNKKN